jgi:cytochrome c oxidase assembly factor CtaG
MFQHELLMSFAVPAMLLSQPYLPVVWGLPAVVRCWVFIPVARNSGVQAFFRTLTHPVVGLGAFTTVMVVWHMPPFYDAALLNDNIHYLEHLSFVVGAGLFWWGIITPYPFQPRLHFFLRIMLVFVSELPNVAISAMIAFAENVIYAYSVLPGFWGETMLEDQHVGGLLMWVGLGATIRLSAALVVLIIHARQEEQNEPPRVLYPTRDGAPTLV